MDDMTRAEAARQAAELILADERLTSDLENAEADILLHWALAAARQEAAACVAYDAMADREAVAEAVHPVRQIARAVNDLVAEYAGLDPNELLIRLLALVDASRQISPAPQPSAAST